MTSIDVRLHTVQPERLVAWLAGKESTLPVPPLSDCTALWVTLEDDKVIRSDILQEVGGAVVAVIQQTALAEKPEAVLPVLARHCLLARQYQQPVHLLLTGGMTIRRQADWQAYTEFACAGRPPLARLLLFILLSALSQGGWILPRLWHLWRRSGRRGPCAN